LQIDNYQKLDELKYLAQEKGKLVKMPHIRHAAKLQTQVS
jgi:hypothetical protein